MTDFEILCDYVEQHNIPFDFDVINSRYRVYRKTFQTPKAALDHARQTYGAINGL